MTPVSTALTTKVESGSPYQLNHEQVLKASTALLKHMKATLPQSEKQSLIPSPNDDESMENSPESTPIWLSLTTKTHIVPKTRLKPSKITLPYPLHTSSTSNICLIVADPQRTYKDLIASPSFPASLSSRISKVVGIAKIKSKWTQYEAQRKLFSEHDIFLADDRIITLLPKLLGKTFYKTTSKRPIPISIAASPQRVDGKKIKTAKSTSASTSPADKAATAPQIAAQIEKALAGTLVNLSPSTQTSVKVGYSHWAAEKLVENIEVVTREVVEKFVVKGWRGVRAIHVKGPETAALPIWLADELWVGEEDVLAEEAVGLVKANEGRKRKSVVESEEGEKTKKTKVVKESNDDKLDQEIAARKQLLKKQKEQAAKDAVDEVPKGMTKTKTGKKGKKAVVA